ncbi:tetratricopeptide repeat protein 31-like isoform X2 [Channa argus]
MKFTRDICRLLGLGGDGPGEEEMQIQDGAPDPTDTRKNQRSSQCVEQVLLNDEGLDDDERARRRAEKRRAKRKRQKERKKLEREERIENASEQDEEMAGVVSESDSEEEFKEEAQWTAVRPRNKSNPISASALVTEIRRNCQVSHEAAEDEPEWDVSSAFVANAASHIKVKGQKNGATQISPENKENEAGSGQAGSTVEMKRRGESLTVQGIEMFKQGQYDQAVDMFTEAIYCDPNDHRFYGNRSCCYSFLEQYSSAITDAQRSIKLAPEWPTGYFRKGCALMGLKRYGEAEKAMEQVLKLNQHCKEASSKLFTCQIQQLMEMGFEEEQSKQLLDKFTTVQAVNASPEAKALKQSSLQDPRGSCRSLWVGNITFEVKEEDLCNIFKM